MPASTKTSTAKKAPNNANGATAAVSNNNAAPSAQAAPQAAAKKKKTIFDAEIRPVGQQHSLTLKPGNGRQNFCKKFTKAIDSVYQKKFMPQPQMALQLVRLGLDRCHRVAYSSMRIDLLKFMDGTISDKQLDAKMRSIVGTDPKLLGKWNHYLNNLKTEKLKVQHSHSSAPIALQKSKEVIRFLKGVLSWLNNLEDNVSIGNAAINRSIQTSNDLNFDLDANGQHSLTPGSRRKAEAQSNDAKIANPVSRRTDANGQTLVQTSVINGGKGGTVAEGSMSPRTRRMIQKLPTG